MTSPFYGRGSGASSAGSDAPDWIHLEEVTFPCVLGLLPWEARESQRLRLDLHLNLDLAAAAGGELARTVDYGALLEQVQFLAQQGRWLLLESLASAIARFVLVPPANGEPRAQVEAAIVRLAKPDVLQGRAVPAVELRRARAALLVEATEVGPGARLEVLQETRQGGAYRLQLAAGASWTPPVETVCLVLAGAVDVDGHACAPGETIARGRHSLRAAAGAACALALARPRVPRAPT